MHNSRACSIILEMVSVACIFCGNRTRSPGCINFALTSRIAGCNTFHCDMVCDLVSNIAETPHEGQHSKCEPFSIHMYQALVSDVDIFVEIDDFHQRFLQYWWYMGSRTWLHTTVSTRFLTFSSETLTKKSIPLYRWL